VASDPVLFAFGYDQGKTGRLVGNDLVAAKLKANELAWVHLDATHGQALEWLRREAPYLDNTILDALLMEETRPRFEEIDQGAIIILRGVNLNEDADPVDMVSVRLWIDDQRIISLQRRKLKAISDVEQKLREGKVAFDSGTFISALILAILDRMEPTLSHIDDRMDELEEQILEEPDSHLRGQIVAIRREAIILRRYNAPQREAVSRMRVSDLPWLSSKLCRRQMQEAHDRLNRFVEDLDAIRERSQIVQDELTTTLADRLNKNMYILSVIAAVFLPLGFLTGLLGINVGGIPGASDPNAFFIFSGLLLIIVILQVVIFRRLRWF